MANNYENYQTLERPYNTFMERSSETGSFDEAAEFLIGNPQEGIGGFMQADRPTIISNPANILPGALVGASLTDTWIETWIKSRSYIPKTAGFYIDGRTGYIECRDFYSGNATIEGNITATTGAIGGWVINATTLTGAGVTLSSAGDAYIAFGTIPPTSPTVGTGIFINKTGLFGLNANTQNFKISATDGSITSILGTIGGWTITSTLLRSGATDAASNIVLDPATGVIRSGATTGDYITIDGANLRIRSSNYASGVFGSGFTLEPNLLEVGNIAARGMIRTSVFQKDVVSAVGGNLAVLDADVLDVDMTALDNSVFTIKGTTTFSVGDILRIKDGIDDEWFAVTDASSAPTYLITRDAAGLYTADNNPTWKKGATVVNYGQSGDGGVYMTASETNAPYLSIFTHAGSPWSVQTQRVRLGNLTGLTNPDTGAALSGYGLWTDNVYLTGVIVANSGKIGGASGWSIGSGYLTSVNGANTTTLASGGTNALIAGPTGSPKITISHDGVLTAQGAVIAGYKLFECIVAGDGDGDYLTVSAALLDGKKRIFVRSGTYTNEPVWELSTGVNITGENKKDTIIQFAVDTTTRNASIYSYNDSDIQISNLTLINYDFTDDQGVLEYDTFNATGWNQKWSIIDPSASFQAPSATSGTGSILIYNSHTPSVTLATNYAQLGDSCDISNFVIAQSYILWSDFGADESKTGFFLWKDNSNYVGVTSGGNGNVTFRRVQGGSETTWDSGIQGDTGVHFKIFLSPNSVKFYNWDSVNSVWVELVSTSTNWASGNVYYRIATEDSNAKSRADVVQISNVFVMDDWIDELLPRYYQDLYYEEGGNSLFVNNCDLQSFIGHFFAGVSEDATFQNIYFDTSDSYDPGNTACFYRVADSNIINCYVYWETTQNGFISIKNCNDLTVSQSNFFSRNSHTVDLVSFSTRVTIMNSNVNLRDFTIYGTSMIGCSIVQNESAAPPGYFMTSFSESNLENNSIDLDKAYDFLESKYHSINIQGNLIRGGKKIKINGYNNIFANNNWRSSYTAAAINLEVGSSSRNSIVLGNVIRHTSGSTTPTITDNGSSTIIEHNQLM